jgi:transcription elongation factor GreA
MLMRLSMANRINFLTRDGYRKLEAELSYLRTVRRAEVARRLHRALEEGGEVGENAEYEDAKNEQSFVEGRIQQLEQLLSTAQIIDEHEVSPDMVQLGSRVTVKQDGEDPETYIMVGAAEANPREGRISNESPLGRALMGRRVGDEVQVNAPDGVLSFKIVAIG